MDRDELFSHTINDLFERLRDDASAYDIIASSALVRKLLLDGGGSLLSHVNMRRRLAITFRYMEVRPNVLRLPSLPDIIVIGSGIDSADNMPELLHASHARGQQRQFLAATVAVLRRKPISVKDIIKHGAHVLGGVHAGVAIDDGARTVEALAATRVQFDVAMRELIGFEDPEYGLSTLKAIGRVTYRALAPLGAVVMTDLAAQGIRIDPPRDRPN